MYRPAPIKYREEIYNILKKYPKYSIFPSKNIYFFHKIISFSPFGANSKHIFTNRYISLHKTRNTKTVKP